MTFYDNAVKYYVDELHDFGITWDTLKSEGYDNIFGFVHDYEMFEKYAPDNPSYEDFSDVIEEDISNSIGFSTRDFNTYLKTALNDLGYDEFKDIEEHNGYNPIVLPDTEEEFLARIKSDKSFADDVYTFIRDAVLLDWPYLGIYLYDDGFYSAVEYRL